MKFTIHKSKEGKLIISDPLAPNGKRAGLNFISFPNSLASKLPGSVMLPNEFVKNNFLQIDPDILISDKFSSTTPILDAKIKTTRLRTYHGSLNIESIKLGKIAQIGFSDEKNRAKYQTSMFHIMKPYLQKDEATYDYWIVEDCLASGDTLIGVLSLLSKSSGMKKVRIDVVVATTIGINLLIEVASKLGVLLTINVGFLAYALSKGEKSGNARLHANYIIYPNELINKTNKTIKTKINKLRAPDGVAYVVGDMGDGAKSINQKFDMSCPWNRYRSDPHGSRNAKKVTEEKPSAKNRKIILYFSNGGYLLRSFVKKLSLDKKYKESVISAKRVWSNDKKYGYGVLLDEI